MSDSLNATVIVSESVLMISANPELELLEDEDPEPPRLPAVADPVPPLPELDDDDDDDELDELPDPPADTVSPGVRLESDAIVPLVGAYSLVLATAVSAACTAACALYTDAWAEARLLGDGVEVVVDVEVVFAAELPLLEGDDRVVLGTITVTVTLGVVFVVLVPALVVTVVPDLVVPVPDLGLPGKVLGVVPGWNAAYSTVWAGAE
jgi:hypothetical protein